MTEWSRHVEHDNSDEEMLYHPDDELAAYLERSGFSITPEEYAALSEAETLRFQRRALLLQRFEESYSQIDSSILRAHQIDGVSGLYDFLLMQNESDQDGGLTKRGVLTHAPGAGKSIFAAFVSSMFGANESLGENIAPTRVLYLTHDRKGLGQTMGKEGVLRGFAKVMPEIPTVMVQKGAPFEDFSVVGMTYAALRYWMKRDRHAFDSFDITFADECQEALGPRTQEALNFIMKGKINIALTGSPELGDDRTVYELWPETIHNISFREGVEERGILNSFILYRFHTGEALKSVVRSGEYLPLSYRHLAKNEFLTEQTRRLALLLASHNIKTTVFAFRGEGSQHAIDLANELDGTTIFDRATQLPRTVQAQPIGNFQSRNKNQQIFEAFDRGEVDIITTTKMGETAWDPARLNAIILLCPTRSMRAIIQRLGRGARISTTPTVIIHYDYDDELQRSPYDVFDEPDRQGAVIISKNMSEKMRESLGNAKEPLVRGIPEKTPLEMLEDTDQKALDEFSVFESLAAFMNQAEIRGRERTALRRGKRDFREQAFTPLTPVARNYGIDQAILEGLLRRNRIKVVSFDEADTHVSYGPRDEVIGFLEQDVAQPKTYSVAQIMARLGASKKWVTGRVADEIGEPRFQRDRIGGRRVFHYSHDVYTRLEKEHAEKAQEIRDDEISVAELCRKYATDPTRTVEWFERRGVSATKRKQQGTKNGAARSGLVCYPKKYELQFAWHWEAEELPPGKQLVTIAKVIERTYTLRHMGHAQRQEVLDSLAVVPRRYRTKTSFNYYVTPEDQAAVQAHCIQLTPRACQDIITPGASAVLIADELDKRAFAAHVRAKHNTVLDDILSRQTTETKADTTEIQEVDNRGETEDIQAWDTEEGLQTTIQIARTLRRYSIGSSIVAAKAKEFGIPLHKRVRQGILYDCITEADSQRFAQQYQETLHIGSLAEIAAILQVPEPFVINIAANHVELTPLNAEPENSYLKRSLEAARQLDHDALRNILEQITTALRGLRVPRPPDGRVLDDKTLERVQTCIVMTQEPLLRQYVYTDTFRQIHK